MASRLNSTSVESFTLVLILVIVGLLAGWTSIGHVIDWTMSNSHPGTPLSSGQTNAAVSELVPIAAALVIRHRRRRGQSIRYPAFLLVSAVAFSLTAQLAVAKPGLSGWVVSAAPSLAFLGITKLVLSMTPPPAAKTVTTLGGTDHRRGGNAGRSADSSVHSECDVA